MTRPKKFVLTYTPSNKKPWKVTVPGTPFNRAFPTFELAKKFFDTAVNLQAPVKQ